ncbi:PB1 domain-containing protein, partial [Trifolium medium]|nr:PB1 domain-containing protein [Trifolium medium]
VPPLEESPPPPPTLNPDYLFGLDKPYSDTPSANQAEFPVTVPDFPAMETECGPETVKETEIQELERMEFVNIEQEVKVDGENAGINGVFDCYTEENAEKVIPLVTNEPEPVQSPTQTLDQIQIQPGSFQVQIPEPVPVQSMFSPVRHHNVTPGGYSMGYPNEPAPVYLIQTSSGLYQALRP